MGAERSQAENDFHVRKLYAGGQLMTPAFPTRGRDWFVDGSRGNDANDGTGWDEPLLTMNRVFTNGLGSGDRIYVTGKIREQLVSPAGVFDVTIIGGGNRPRHADQHTGNGGYSGATWAAPASPTATTALLRIQQQGWRVANMLWAPHTDYGALEWVRNDGAGDLERDASHGHIIGCRFAGGKYHVIAGASGYAENLFNLCVEDCDLNDATTMSMFQGAGGTYRFKLLRNRFMANVSHVDLSLVESEVRGNSFGKFTTKALDLTGGSDNIVTENYFSGDYSTASGAYVAGTTDGWFGNFATDVAEAEVDPNGLTTAVPAA